MKDSQKGTPPAPLRGGPLGAGNSVVTDYRQRINLAARFIRQHASRSLTISEVAEVANFSPFHFHRIFTAFTGETIFEYLTRHRMMKAVELLMAGHGSGHIAQETGFQTTAAFTKTFKKTYGLSPTLYKQNNSGQRLSFVLGGAKKASGRSGNLAGHTGKAHSVEPPVRPDELTAHSSGLAVRPDEHHSIDLPAHPLIKDLPDLSVLFVRRKGRINGTFIKAADEAFTVLFTILAAGRPDVIGGPGASNTNWPSPNLGRVGILEDRGLIISEECRFDAGLIVQEGTRPPDNPEIRATTIAAGKWAVFRHQGGYDSLWQTWGKAYRHWPSSEKYRFRDAAPFELYHNSPIDTAPEDLITDIHIPIL